MRPGESSPPSVKWNMLTDGVTRADAPERVCALTLTFKVRRTGTRASNTNLLTPRNFCEAMTLSFSIEIGCEAKPASIDRKGKGRKRTERGSLGDVLV